ncbi:hypothetical protein BWP39_15310 [Paraburkholderia acidicola]|uniref:Peptide-binding protein n=1 Tax=Paraburkholderia acidicola TaxID=1912599 RepID=A0A2A4EYF3_9BURK|nr:hypothetical protein [Paraburkholderia acidicola]PCE25895.1 hypothetical protein BWP39_15310 [Paraburkholderia acidicola]
MGAILVALASFAHARPVMMSHGGFGGGGGHFAHFAPRSFAARPDVHSFSSYGNRSDRVMNVARGPGAMPGGNGFRGMPRMTSRVAPQYAGAITPVSAEARPVPRPSGNPTIVRAGSIREDVARYNEERGFSRPAPRPPDDMSRPGASPYRN